MEKHSSGSPGYKAGIRREFGRLGKNIVLGQAMGTLPTTMEDAIRSIELDDPQRSKGGELYDMGDAILEDLMGNTSYLTSMSDPKPQYLAPQYTSLKNAVREQIQSVQQHQQLRQKRQTMLDENEIQITDTDTNNSQHSSLKNTVKKQIQSVQQHQQLHQKIQTLPDENKIQITNTNTNNIQPPPPPSLPSDAKLSKLLRAHRQAITSKPSHRPGLMSSLQLLLSDLNVPIKALGQSSFHALLSNCANEKEIRRVFQLMEHQPQQHLSTPRVTVGSYAYSILVDVLADKGDYKRALQIIQEAKQKHNIQLGLPAYTSLLKACHKIITADGGTIPWHIRSDAAKVAWDSWKEMKIVGLDPDVMAFGAIIRIMSARGLPEQVLNFIEEMQQMSIKPTTLIYTSALRAVAKSHANTLRFEGGKSKKNKRREQITAHHGQMVRKILILADNSEIQQDNGFISALMLCASTAGDAATAKAIYLASQVKMHMKHLRVIDGESNTPFHHLLPQRPKQISDSTTFATLPSSETNAIFNQTKSSEPKNISYYDDRQTTKDMRTITALLRANANAMESGGLGNLWSGHNNQGYLDEPSLRLLTTRPKPIYLNKSIPGMSDLEAGVTSLKWDTGEEEDDRGRGSADHGLIEGRLKRKKFTGGHIDEDAGLRMDEIDPSLYDMLEEDFAKQNHWDLNDVELEGDGNAIGDYETFVKSQTETTHSGSKSDIEVIQSANNENKIFDAGTSIDEGKSRRNKSWPENHNPPSLYVKNKDEINGTSLMADSAELKQPLSLIEDNKLIELREMLPGMPDHRLVKVYDAFKETFGNPSMLRIVPLLRENMPRVITNTWLKKKNLKDANFVMAHAENEGCVNIDILDAMMLVLAKSGSLDKVLEFHEVEYKKRGLKPTEYSDRLAFQMLLENNRLTRSLQFKNRVELSGRKLDLLAYGSLIEYYGNHRQLGSAIMTLKECISIHRSPPGEKCLSSIRLMCRKEGLEDDIGLNNLIGKDPTKWIRHGERNLKREYSKKGRKQVDLPRNRLLQL